MDGKILSLSSGYTLSIEDSGNTVKITKGGESSIKDIKYIALELAIQKVYDAFNIDENNVPLELK